MPWPRVKCVERLAHLAEIAASGRVVERAVDLSHHAAVAEFVNRPKHAVYRRAGPGSGRNPGYRHRRPLQPAAVGRLVQLSHLENVRDRVRHIAGVDQPDRVAGPRHRYQPRVVAILTQVGGRDRCLRHRQQRRFKRLGDHPGRFRLDVPHPNAPHVLRRHPVLLLDNRRDHQLLPFHAVFGGSRLAVPPVAVMLVADQAVERAILLFDPLVVPALHRCGH